MVAFTSQGMLYFRRKDNLGPIKLTIRRQYIAMNALLSDFLSRNLSSHFYARDSCGMPGSR